MSQPELEVVYVWEQRQEGLVLAEPLAVVHLEVVAQLQSTQSMEEACLALG